MYGHLEPVLRLPMGKLYLRIYNVQLLDPLPIVDLVIYQAHPPITGSAVSQKKIITHVCSVKNEKTIEGEWGGTRGGA